MRVYDERKLNGECVYCGAILVGAEREYSGCRACRVRKARLDAEKKKNRIMAEAKKNNQEVTEAQASRCSSCPFGTIIVTKQDSSNGRRIIHCNFGYGVCWWTNNSRITREVVDNAEV